MAKIIKKISSYIAIGLLCFFSLFEGLAAPTVYADDTLSLQEEFENINVLDDLKDMTIDEENFSLLDYNFDEKKNLQILSFVEFCYSFYADYQDNYGLYVYVYNPQGLKIDQNSSLHSISICHGDDTNQSFIKYRLQFLNCSTGNYYGLFYKFKVVLSDTQKTEILQGSHKVNSTARRYEVSEIELKVSTELNASSYEVGSIYVFSGYAKGYGADEEAASTLTMLTEGNQEVISLDVHSTFYRPEGTNGKNDYTQDSLHSVYFAVPNEYIEKYGEMYAVHATWLNAVLKPLLVTGNKDAYNAIETFLGTTLPEYTATNNITTYYSEALKYAYYGALTSDGAGDSRSFSYGYGYNTVGKALGNMHQTKTGTLLDTLYGLFFSGNEVDSADEYVVSSEKIQEQMLASKTAFGGELVNDKYSRDIFDSVDDAFTEVNLSRDDAVLGKSYLTSQKLTQTYWERFWGKKNYTTMETDTISVIEAVTDEKMKGTQTEVCDRLYVFEGDYDDFKSYYDTNKDSCTVYLFRYMVSDYISQEATLCEYTSEGFLFGSGWKEVDTNAYFFQETVNLDFDIIDLTFLKDDVYTVIPVAMSPIDIIPDATPPVDTNSDKNGCNNFNWKKVFALLCLIVLIIILLPILPTIITVLIKIICLPFKILGAILKKIFHKRE